MKQRPLLVQAYFNKVRQDIKDSNILNKKSNLDNDSKIGSGERVKNYDGCGWCVNEKKLHQTRSENK